MGLIIAQQLAIYSLLSAKVLHSTSFADKLSHFWVTSMRQSLLALRHQIRLKGDEAKHEQTDAWSNRDLIPLPPERRTWGWFNYYGFWAIASLNLANWQTPSTYLSMS
jgi:hypothetical protein